MAPQKPSKNEKKKRPTAQKRILQAKQRHVRNRAVKSQIRSTRRDLLENISEKSDISELYSIVDKAVKKGVIKLGKARRIKSQMALKIAATAV